MGWVSLLLFRRLKVQLEQNLCHSEINSNVKGYRLIRGTKGVGFILISWGSAKQSTRMDEVGWILPPPECDFNVLSFSTFSGIL